jgi:hypothetical protein
MTGNGIIWSQERTVQELKYIPDGEYDNGRNKVTAPNSNINLKVIIGNLPGYSLYFNGLIDDVKIYNRSLPAAEIKADYLH